MPAKKTYVLRVLKDGTILVNGAEPHKWPNSNGYLTFKTGRNVRRLVHREVALVLVPNPKKLSDVNHIDGNKLNNHPSNLEWVSRKDNLLHAMRNGLHANPEKAVRGVHEKTGKVVRFVSLAEAARNGFTQANISHCLSGRRPRHKGYQWYEDAPA